MKLLFLLALTVSQLPAVAGAAEMTELQRLRVELVGSGLRRLQIFEQMNSPMVPRFEFRTRMHMRLALQEGLSPEALESAVSEYLLHPPSRTDSLIDDELFAGETPAAEAEYQRAMQWLRASLKEGSI